MISLGMIGAGFWGEFQAAAWSEVAGARVVAICDRDRPKAEAFARKFKIPHVYSDAETMLRSGAVDAVDIVAGPESHEALVTLAAGCQRPVICQKPMALDYAACRRMVAACQAAGVPLLIHENYRWQAPFRRTQQLLQSGRIGRPFRAHLQFSHGDLRFFERQPYLFEQPHFALFDMGPHLLDLPRFLFGEPESLVARASKVHPRFAGEDIVSVMLYYELFTCHCELSWQTSGYELFVEGEQGTLVWYPDGRLIVADRGGGKVTETLTPEPFAWADSDYGFAHSSIVATNRHLLAALTGETPAETTGADNLRTMRLIFLALESARRGEVVAVADANGDQTLT